MIYIGLLIPSLWPRIPHINKRRLQIPLIFKLFAFPLAVLGIMLILPCDPLLRAIFVVQATMPSLALAPVLFQRYEADVDFGAAATIISTLGSLATIPLMVLVASFFIHF